MYARFSARDWDILALWSLCAVNDSYTDPKTRIQKTHYSLDWGAFQAALAAEHPAFRHEPPHELMHLLTIIRAELSS